MVEKETIEKLVIEKIEDLNKRLFIVEISVSASNLIRVEIDAEDENVSIKDCILISRFIENNLDRESEDFELQVSSAGLDKPLRVLKQYIKNIGRNVKVFLKENNKIIEGVLTYADEKGIKLETATKELVEGKKKKVLIVRENEYTFNEIKETKIVISFKK